MGAVYRIVRAAFFRIEAVAKILAVRAAYAAVLCRIRARKPGTRIRVLFLVSEVSKWKAQSLYDLMAESDNYEPMMGITLADFDGHLSDVEQREKMDRTRRFFENKGMHCEMMYDAEGKNVREVRELGVDVVFYQQPYVIFPAHMPRFVGLTALTCYIPYYVTNYGTRSFDYEMPFHKEVWRYFILSEGFARVYRRGAWFFAYAGKLLGIGHTGLDYYYLNREKVQTDEKTVIYAPHWSFSHPQNENHENYSTFLWTGERILEYAKRHPEFNWIYRPHPSLEFALKKTGVWSNEKIAKYWAEWAQVGTVSAGGDYQHLLLESKAMITDCGSFLPEYFVTGKPLIHLISKDVKVQPISVSKQYFDTFYRVTSEDQLEEILNEVLVAGNDSRREVRARVLRDSGMADCYAARNILSFLNGILGRGGL